MFHCGTPGSARDEHEDRGIRRGRGARGDKAREPAAVRGLEDAGLSQQVDRMPIRVIAADDHPVVLHGLDRLLQQHADFSVVARCATGHEAVAATRLHRPDILVVDLNLPDMDGLAVLRELQDVDPPVRAVLLTAHLTEDQLIEGLRLGVRGVVLKEMATRLLVECLRRVHAGGQWLEKNSASRAMAKLIGREAKAREVATLLTPREIEVVRLTAAGRSNKEIAEQLFIAEGTVKIHLHNIYGKAKVSRRAELIRWAHDYGLA
jgi:DNA-binding NarL/FixJ family response regulator